MPGAEVTRLSGQTWGDDPAQVPGTAFPKPQTPSLNEGLPADTISASPKPPLAVNLSLTTAAENYSQTLLDNNAFTHTFNGTDPGGRMNAAGYPAFSAAGENLGSNIASSSIASKADMDAIEAQLFVDNNTSGRGHRTNLMSTAYRDVGIGAREKNNYTGFGFTANVTIAAEDFASQLNNTNAFLTGVAYNDSVVKDSFYTPGEGLAGVTIRAVLASDPTKIFTTTTYSAGGYELQLPAGSYLVTALGGPLTGTISAGTVTIGTDNVEQDFVPVGTPEPAALSLLALAAPALLARRRR